MKQIDERLEQHLAEVVPNWVRAVRDSKAGDMIVILSLEAFADEPQLLYDALWYANEIGVDVTLAGSQHGGH
jgi:hypothetical protein